MRVLVGKVSKGYSASYLATLEWDEDGTVTHIVTHDLASEADAIAWLEAAAPTYVVPVGTVVYEKTWADS